MSLHTRIQPPKGVRRPLGGGDAPALELKPDVAPPPPIASPPPRTSAPTTAPPVQVTPVEKPKKATDKLAERSVDEVSKICAEYAAGVVIDNIFDTYRIGADELEALVKKYPGLQARRDGNLAASGPRAALPVQAVARVTTHPAAAPAAITAPMTSPPKGPRAAAAKQPEPEPAASAPSAPPSKRNVLDEKLLIHIRAHASNGWDAAAVAEKFKLPIEFIDEVNEHAGNEEAFRDLSPPTVREQLGLEPGAPFPVYCSWPTVIYNTVWKMLDAHVRDREGNSTPAEIAELLGADLADVEEMHGAVIEAVAGERAEQLQVDETITPEAAALEQAEQREPTPFDQSDAELAAEAAVLDQLEEQRAAQPGQPQNEPATVQLGGAGFSSSGPYAPAQSAPTTVASTTDGPRRLTKADREIIRARHAAEGSSLNVVALAGELNLRGESVAKVVAELDEEAAKMQTEIATAGAAIASALGVTSAQGAQIAAGLEPTNGLVCEVCGLPQFLTASGAICNEGHGGAGGITQAEWSTRAAARPVLEHPPVTLAPPPPAPEEPLSATPQQIAAVFTRVGFLLAQDGSPPVENLIAVFRIVADIERATGLKAHDIVRLLQWGGV